MKSIWITWALLACTSLGAQAQSNAPLVPVVNNAGSLLGASRDGRWLSLKQAGPLLRGGEKYRFYNLKGYDKTYTGSKPTKDEDDSWGNYSVPIQKSADNEDLDSIGLAGSWNPMPRRLRLEGTHQKVYLDAVAAILKEKGLSGAAPNIIRQMRVDLLGKGEDAVLIEAASPNYKLSMGHDGGSPRRNAYSFVMLRLAAGGKVKTFLLGDAFYPTGGKQKNVVLQYHLAQVLDLNGDGVLEVVVSSRYYEGGGTSVYEIKSGSPKIVMAMGYGN